MLKARANWLYVFSLEAEVMRIRSAVAATALVVLSGQVANVQAEAVIEMVTVGNPGNDGELNGEGVGGWGPDRICGAVNYVYNIGKFEVTAGQYTEFLNAVADNDSHGLYITLMADLPSYRGCNIQRSGSPGSYSYSVADDWADRPVNYVSWGDAARFCNWLHNGRPTGTQDSSTTEDGSYYLNGATSDAALLDVVRKVDATWVIPSEDEWYKAAYHYNDGVTGNYWDYPMESDIVPVSEVPPGTNMTRGSANWYYGEYVIGSPYYRTEVGAYDARPSDSPYGTFDQGGNISEWNETVLSGSFRGLRGGYFLSLGYYLRAENGSSNYPALSSDGMGFRVAYVGPLCGDGTVDNSEQCDDADAHNGDGCSSSCTVEDGWECTGEPSMCTEICGDGIIVGLEECDGGLGCTDCLCDADFEPTVPPSLDCLEQEGVCCDHATGTCLGWMTALACMAQPPPSQPEFFKGITCGDPGFDCWEHTGACCLAGSCTDDVPESDCRTWKWWKNTQCSDPEVAAVCEAQIPTLPEWGLAALMLLVLTAGTVVFGRRQRQAT